MAHNILLIITTAMRTSEATCVSFNLMLLASHSFSRVWRDFTFFKIMLLIGCLLVLILNGKYKESDVRSKYKIYVISHWNGIFIDL
jgi:uncharacterized membrane protein YphA (DoxX/SURF4 family)